MWIAAIFAREFGFSDVQSNYSRVYAWMANQLGHMTLGLATALFFVWIADTVSGATRLLADWKGRPTAAAGDCEFAVACLGNNLLLPAVAAALLAAALLAALRLLAADLPAETRRRAIPPAARKALAAAFLLLALVALAAPALRALGPEGGERDARLLGVVAATLWLGAGVLTLCRDLRYLVFALLALFGAFWIATSGAGAPEAARRWVAVALAVLFWGYALVSTVWSKTMPEQMGGLERGIQAAVATILALWFVSGTWNGLEGDWPLAVGAAVGSCTLWWIKEFGSDLPNVDDEIRAARARRPAGLYGPSAEVERDYFNDARMDARTDALFYFAGALTAAGVLSRTPVMTATMWETGAELLGLVVFMAIFLVVGKNWAFRQQALDLAGLDAASRLAVIHAGLRLHTPAHGGGWSASDDPLDALRIFARGEGDAGFDHLLVFAGAGSGATPLARALVSEAALATWPTLAGRLGLRRQAQPVRTGRYLRCAGLVHAGRDLAQRRDLTATPTVALDVGPGPDGEVRIAAGPAPAAGFERIAHASLVAIDDAGTPDAATLAACRGNLALQAGQRTVWVLDGRAFDPGDGEPAGPEAIAAWRPDPEAARGTIEAMRALLAAGGPPPRLAVAFTRRCGGPARG